MDPPRCHRLCDFFGTVAGFSVSLLSLFHCFFSFTAFSVSLFPQFLLSQSLLLSAAVLRPPLRRGLSVWLGKELFGSCRKAVALVLSRRRRLQYLLLCSALVVLRFLTAQGLYFPSVRVACRSGWVGLVSARTPARLSRLPSPRSFVFGGIAPRKGFGLLVLLGYARCRACTCSLSTS